VFQRGPTFDLSFHDAHVLLYLRTLLLCVRCVFTVCWHVFWGVRRKC
jgi:hypothetical protein